MIIITLALLALLFNDNGCSAAGVRGRRDLAEMSRDIIIPQGQSRSFICSNLHSRGNGCMATPSDWQYRFVENDTGINPNGAYRNCLNPNGCKLTCSITVSQI